MISKSSPKQVLSPVSQGRPRPPGVPPGQKVFFLLFFFLLNMSPTHYPKVITACSSTAVWQADRDANSGASCRCSFQIAMALELVAARAGHKLSHAWGRISDEENTTGKERGKNKEKREKSKRKEGVTGTIRPRHRGDRARKRSTPRERTTHNAPATMAHQGATWRRQHLGMRESARGTDEYVVRVYPLNLKQNANTSSVVCAEYYRTGKVVCGADAAGQAKPLRCKPSRLWTALPHETRQHAEKKIDREVMDLSNSGTTACYRTSLPPSSGILPSAERKGNVTGAVGKRTRPRFSLFPLFNADQGDCMRKKKRTKGFCNYAVFFRYVVLTLEKLGVKSQSACISLSWLSHLSHASQPALPAQRRIQSPE